MKDFSLERLESMGAKFVIIKPNSKIPYGKNWQQTPLSLDQIGDGFGVGINLGYSNIIAIDFDGYTAYKVWKNIGCTREQIENTISWTSGRQFRRQCLFKVPQELVEFLQTRKYGLTKSTSAKKTLEFRWKGSQSVLPPSVHPDGFPYRWIHGPINYSTIPELPYAALEFWLNDCTSGGIQANGGIAAYVAPKKPRAAEVISHRETFKGKGGRIISLDNLSVGGKGEPVCCPFHDDKMPSAFVRRLSNYNGFLYCSSCDTTWKIGIKGLGGKA